MGKTKDWFMELEEQARLAEQQREEARSKVQDVRKETTRESVLNEANSIVNGARAQTYGGPEDSFQTIANLWSAYTKVGYSPADVAIMLALLKIARLQTSPNHRDSWVDLAGYAACGAECGLK